MRILRFLAALACTACAYDNAVTASFPISNVVQGLQALADAQVLTIVSPEGSPLVDQNYRIRVTKVALQADPATNRLKWTLTALAAVRKAAVPVSGAITVSAVTNSLSATVVPNGIQISGCMDHASATVSTEAILQPFASVLTSVVNNAVNGVLPICARVVAPGEGLLPGWVDKLPLAKISTTIDAKTNAIVLRLELPPAAPLVNTQFPSGDVAPLL